MNEGGWLEEGLPHAGPLHEKAKREIPDFPKMSHSTFRRILDRLGYSWRPRRENGRPQWIRKLCLVQQRDTFAKHFFSAIADGRKIYYTNEVRDNFWGSVGLNSDQTRAKNPFFPTVLRTSVLQLQLLLAERFCPVMSGRFPDSGHCQL